MINDFLAHNICHLFHPSLSASCTKHVSYLCSQLTARSRERGSWLDHRKDQQQTFSYIYELPVIPTKQKYAKGTFISWKLYDLRIYTVHYTVHIHYTHYTDCSNQSVLALYINLNCTILYNV